MRGTIAEAYIRFAIMAFWFFVLGDFIMYMDVPGESDSVCIHALTLSDGWARFRYYLALGYR